MLVLRLQDAEYVKGNPGCARAMPLWIRATLIIEQDWDEMEKTELNLRGIPAEVQDNLAVVGHALCGCINGIRHDAQLCLSL